MDTSALAAFLSPFLPFLLKIGKQSTEKTAEVVSTKLSTIAWQKAQAIWNKLRPKIVAKEAAKEAVEDVARNPNDEDMQASFRLQLKKLLEQDETLKREIIEIMDEEAPDGTPGRQIINNVIQNIYGDRNITFGSNSGSVTIHPNN